VPLEALTHHPNCHQPYPVEKTIASTGRPEYGHLIASPTFRELRLPSEAKTGVNPKPDAMNETMMLTHDFKQLVQKQVAADPAFGEALLRESMEAMLSGDLETGKALLRDYIKATIGFEVLGTETGTPPKSLIRMLGPRGNPQARNLFTVLGHLHRRAGLDVHVATRRG
jgi:hypothetical protein